MAMSNLLEVRNLSVVYRSHGSAFVAVKGVDFDLAPGSVTALIGESGSGKTSISRAVAGLQPPAAGSTIAMRDSSANVVEIAGARTAGRLGIQMVHQNSYSALNPRWSASKSVMEPLGNSSPRSARVARARTMLRRVGLNDELHDRRPSQLSGGQRQRVCIARALAGDSRLLILDEAVSALDVTVKRDILKLLKDLRDELGLSMLFVTHEMSVVKYIADNALVMHRGDFVEGGPTRDILDNPAEPYTQRLIRSVPRLPATAQSSSTIDTKEGNDQ